MPETNEPIYVVLRRHWRVGGENAEEVPADDPRPDVRPCPYREGAFEIVTYVRDPGDGGYPVRAFRDYARAASYCREQELARRAATNPFRYGHNLESRTSLDLGRLCDWLLDAGLTPPGPKWEEKPERIRKAWQGWWKKVRQGLTERQRVSLAEAVRCALVERWFGPADDEGPTDLGWLDEQFAGVERWAVVRRAVLRLRLFGVGLQQYPAQAGERDHGRVEAKWRGWWDKHSPAMTEYQRAQVWEALEKVRFYEVVELDAP